MYKQSQFNVIQPIDKEYLIFNTLSGAMAKLNRETLNRLENIENMTLDALELQNMIKCGFIIKQSVSEVEDLKKIQYQKRNTTNSLNLVIAPTLECNFNCGYCYESPEKGIITKEGQDNILKFCKDTLSSNKITTINVCWYGGEPLLYPDIIDNLSLNFLQMCKDYNIKYTAIAVSNGSLIDNRLADKLINNHIDKIQITLDGVEQVHNKRRPYMNNGNSFEKVINGIENLLSRDIQVLIRMNVDKGNQFEIEPLLKYLSTRFINKSNLKFSLGCIFANDDNTYITNELLTSEEFSQIKYNTIFLLEKYGFTTSVKNILRSKKINYCGATKRLSYVISPTGDIYKCWNDIGKKELLIGNLDKAGKLENKLNDRCEKWLSHSIYINEKCKGCNVLPLCGGGCPRQQINCNKLPICEDIRFNIKQLVKLLYSQKIRR
ncbi:MAG: hypothetical protein ATN36_04755 [Epulopiscium sp. Nele67-Bin005]|nr:MAG: hypothetical protein ATN36_04755 [Epulopiscium sp. Nele67-Bin005]